MYSATLNGNRFSGEIPLSARHAGIGGSRDNHAQQPSARILKMKPLKIETVADRPRQSRRGCQRYLSSLKMSATTFHWPSRVCQFTTNLPTLDVGFPWASLTVVSKVPIS